MDCLHACALMMNSLADRLVGRFYIALFCASEQTLCVLVACDTGRMTVARFLNIHRSGVLTALFGSYIAGET